MLPWFFIVNRENLGVVVGYVRRGKVILISTFIGQPPL